MGQKSPDANKVVHERLTSIFRENFDQARLDIRDEFTAKEIAGWDSLMQVNLIVSIEDEFNLRFTTEEIASISCIGEMKQAILAKQAA